MERRAHRAALGLAVPASVGELLAQQSVDESIAPFAEVRAECDDAAVDAGFDLAFEEGRVSEPGSPGDGVANAIDRRACALACRIESQVAEEHEGVHVRPPERRGDAVAPLAVRALLIEQSR